MENAEKEPLLTEHKAIQAGRVPEGLEREKGVGHRASWLVAWCPAVSTGLGAGAPSFGLCQASCVMLMNYVLLLASVSPSVE